MAKTSHFQFGIGRLLVLTSAVAIVMAVSIRLEVPQFAQWTFAAYLLLIVVWAVMRGPSVYAKVVETRTQKRTLAQRRNELENEAMEVRKNRKAMPTRIGGGSVICFSPVDERHRHTGNCRQIVAGVLQGPVAGLAICQLDDDDAFYLFGCDAAWKVITDTWHESLDDAKEQAEFEYEGISETWQSST